MRDSTYIIDGTITDYLHGALTIKAPCEDWELLCKRQISKVKVQLIDGRKLSDKQRRACYALIGAIADWSGDDKASIKQYMKMEFWKDHLEDLNDQIFSLSNAPMSLVAEFSGSWCGLSYRTISRPNGACWTWWTMLGITSIAV